MEQILQFDLTAFRTYPTNKKWGVLLIFLSIFSFQSLNANPEPPGCATVEGGDCLGCDASMSVTFDCSCQCITVRACKDLSNIVLLTQNGAKVKYENLSGQMETLCSPDDSPIITVWVKAGCFRSGDGPGYGRRFDNPNDCDEPRLPVELQSFTAKLIEGNKVQLDWVTESEENNNFFVIERSTDGDRFQAIGTIEGNGTSSAINTYDFIDRSPFFGRNYYRLKQVDFDGKFDFSQVESVVIDDENLPDVIVYPNPTKDFTTLRVVSPFAQDASIEIINSMGQVLETLTIDQGANSLQIDLRKHQPGFYFININYDGFKKLVHKVLKVED